MLWAARSPRPTTGQDHAYGYDDLSRLITETDSSGTWINYIFFGGQRLARNIGGDIKYYVTDHLHSTAVFADRSGALLDDNDFYPWGGVVPGIGISSSTNHYKFSGKERDTESQLDYFGARYYANGTGRFMSPDWAAKPTTVPYAKFGDPQSLNLYSYVENGPVNSIDPDGHEDNKVVILERLVAAFTAAVNIYVGSEKVFATAPAIALAPETGFTAPLAAYLGINGTGQVVSGGLQGGYALTGDKKLQEGANAATGMTTVTGAITLAVTGDANKAGMIGSVENVGAGIATISALGQNEDGIKNTLAAFEAMFTTFEVFFGIREDKPKTSPTPTPAPKPAPAPQPQQKNKPKQKTKSSGPGNSGYSVGPDPGATTGLKCQGNGCSH